MGKDERDISNKTGRAPLDPPPSEIRQQRLDLLTQVCDWRKIVVADARAEFGIPAGVFLEHVNNESLAWLLSSMSHVAAWLVGHCGRLEPAAFHAICVEPLWRLVDKLEEVSEARIDDIRRSGVDLLRDETPDSIAESAPAILSLVAKMIDQSGHETLETAKLRGERPLRRIRKSQSKISSRKAPRRARAAKTGKAP